MNLKTLRRLRADAPPVCDSIEQMRELSKRGGNRRSERLEDFKRNDNAFEKPARGDAASYALRRLRAKRSDLVSKNFGGRNFSVTTKPDAARRRIKNLALSTSRQFCKRGSRNLSRCGRRAQNTFNLCGRERPARKTANQKSRTVKLGEPKIHRGRQAGK